MIQSAHSRPGHSGSSFGSLRSIVGAPITAGKFVNPMLAKACTQANGDLNYSPFWYAVGGVALVATIILALFFRDESESEPSETRVESESAT